MYLPLMSKLVEAEYCWLYTTTVQLALKKKIKIPFLVIPLNIEVVT